jgi:hypothetical protein
MTVLQADYSFFFLIFPDFFVSIIVKDLTGKYKDASFKFSNTEVERFHTCVLALNNLPPDLQDIMVKSGQQERLIYTQMPIISREDRA